MVKKGITVVCDENEEYGFDEIAKLVYTELKQREALSVEIMSVDEEEIRRLNKEFRNIDKVTDVLSFPSLENVFGKVITKKSYPIDYDEESKTIFIGSIAICKSRAKEQAEEYGHSERRETLYLACHGLLHLFGFDHIDESDKKIMRETEEKIMNAAGVGRDN